MFKNENALKIKLRLGVPILPTHNAVLKKKKMLFPKCVKHILNSNEIHYSYLNK